MRASVIFWGILLWFILFVPFVSFPLDISINPDKELLIDVPYGEDQGKGKLEISNNGNNEIGVEIKASGLTQKGSDKTANLSFSEKEEKTKLNITLKKSETKEITLIASNINVTEEFTGTIQFNAGAEKPELNVTVKKSKPLPPIELEDLTDGKLKLVMDSPYKLNYEFKLKNPEGSIYRELELKDIELQNDGKVITGVISLEGIKANVKKNISLEPGESKKVFISFQPLPGKGIYVGTLVINDFKNNRIEKEFGVSLECPYITFKKIFDNTWITTWAVVFCLVLLGALCSFLLMKLVPISSDKRKNREKIVLLDEQIQQIKPNLKNLKTKFAVGLIKSKTLNDNTKMWTLSASERLKTVSTNLEGIESQLSIVKKIENIYNDIDSRDFIPFSKEQDIRVILKDAQLYLYQDKTDVVDNILKEVDDLLKFNSSDGQVVKNYFNNLNDNIEKLEAELKGENICIYDLLPELSIVQKFDEIKKLKADTAKLEERINTGITDFIKDLRDWDLTYNKLSIYKKFSKILDEEQYGKQKEEVKNFLESDQYEDIDNAIALCESLKIHVSMEDIECAIENKKYHIVYDPPDPDVDGLITFELQFDDEKLNKSPLVNKFRYIWDFDDKTRRTEGIKVIHYFRRRGPFILVRKWFRRKWVFISPKRLIWKTFVVSISVSKLKSEIAELNKNNDIKIDVHVREPLDRAYRSGITFIECLGIVITLIITCLVLMTTNLTDPDKFYSFKSLKDFLVPFSLSFGLDIGREKLFELIKPKSVQALADKEI